ncbi:MAG: hypothetical protein AB7S78_14115 [Candidatus Omnitrophota bacterium]
MKPLFSHRNRSPEFPFGNLFFMARKARIFYTESMSIDRKKPITGKELQELIERDKEAVASLACEGIFLTSEEKSVFEEMNRLGLSYEQRDKYLDDWMHRTYGIPLPDPK